jgi:hypothetical protein
MGFFDEDTVINWKKHWKGMPEFIQDDQTPFQSVVIHFNEYGMQLITKED